MPDDHFRPRLGRDGHNSRVSKKPQTPMNNTNSNRNATNISNLHIKPLALNEGKLSQGFGFHGQNRRTFANSQISDTNV